MGLFDSLFGGSKTKSTPVDMTGAALKGLRNPFAAVLGANLPNFPGISNPALTTDRAPSAPMTAMEQAALADVGSLATDPTRRGLIQTTLEGGFLPGQPGGNPFLQAVIDAANRSTIRAHEELTGRQLPGAFSAAGHIVRPGSDRGSSAFARARALADEAAINQIGDQTASIQAAAYEQERARMAQALTYSQSEIESAIKNFQVQQFPRNIKQMSIEQAIAGQGQAQLAWLQFMALINAAQAPVVAQQGEATNYGQGIFGALFPRGIAQPAPR